MSPTLYNVFVHDLPDTPYHTKNFSYADDITQLIITHPRKDFHVEKVGQEIERINEYEKKWKIQTNLSKFKVVHLDRRTYPEIRAGNRVIQSSVTGTMLGLNFTRTGFSAHVRKIREKVIPDMRRLWSMREMGMDSKRKVFEAIITSKMTYPSVPLHCANITSMRILQRIQNTGARFITGISRLERKTSKYINERAGLRPINLILYERALKTWNKIRTTMREEFEGVYTYRAPSKKSWPLSIPVVLGGEPPEMYG